MPVVPPEIDLSIVLPAYREADSLDRLLPALQRVAGSLAAKVDILVVDSQEPMDATAAICRRYQVGHIHRTGGNLFGDAVRSGIRSARGKYLLFMDADGSHNPEAVRLLWGSRDKADVIIGSRYIQGGGTENPAVLIFLSWIVNIAFRGLLGLKCRDVSNSLRLYRADDLRSLDLVAKNFDIVEEILIKLMFGTQKRSVLEVPVVFERRKAGASKRSLVRFAFGYCGTLLRLARFKRQILAQKGS